MTRPATAAYYLLIPVVFAAVGWFANVAYNLPRSSNPIAQVKPTPLDKYTIENLSKAKISPISIKVGEVLKIDPRFTSYKFSFSFDPTLADGAEKKVSGLINIPKGRGAFPLIVMLRGYVDQELYKTGMGTQRAGEYFARNGFITIAPDFLGYGESDSEAKDIFESRFQTYTTALVLLKSLNGSTVQPFEYSAVGIWAHSNGGQIALTALETSGANYPTVLWAPNSAKFPYSILYYLDEAPDNGKLVITKLSEFMSTYDVSKYSFSNYLARIKAPIQLNQGTADAAVPSNWSTLLDKNLKEASVSATYIKYPGADHNLNPSWQSAVENSLSFFKLHLK